MERTLEEQLAWCVKCRAEERAKLRRQGKALSDAQKAIHHLKQTIDHMRLQLERANQEGGPAIYDLTQCSLKIENQRRELRRLNERADKAEARVTELETELAKPTRVVLRKVPAPTISFDD